MKKIIDLLNLDVKMVFVYVDDFRVAMEDIPFGYSFDHKQYKWIYDDNKAKLEEASMSPEDKTKSELLNIMNKVNKTLTFTTESQIEYEDNMLPTLDTKLGW